MRRHLTFLSAALIGGALATLAGDASAAVLYSDSFSRVTGSGDGNGDPNGGDPNFSDWGTNDNALGGSNTMAWNAGPSRAGGGRNAVTDGALGLSHGTSSIYDFDVTGLAPNGFSVALDFARYVNVPDPGPGPGGYIAFGLGVDSGAVPNDFTAIGASDWSILFQQMASGNTGNAAVRTDNGTATEFDYGNPDVPHTLLLTVTPDNPGAYGDTDGITVDVLVDGSVAQSCITTGGADFGTFTVSANNFEARFIDNLVVRSVPEPTTIALTGLAMAALLLVRRQD